MAELPETSTPLELWDGEPRMSPTPSFRHQKIVLRLLRLLDDYVQARALGEVIAAPIDMVLSPHCVVQPDVAFISKDRIHIVERVIMGPVDLAVEVVSLGSRHRDRIEKRDLYEQYGVQEYWIIDPEPRTVEVLFLSQGRYDLVGRWNADPTRGAVKAQSRLLPGFEVDPVALFAEP